MRGLSTLAVAIALAEIFDVNLEDEIERLRLMTFVAEAAATKTRKVAA